MSFLKMDLFVTRRKISELGYVNVSGTRFASVQQIIRIADPKYFICSLLFYFLSK